MDESADNSEGADKKSEGQAHEGNLPVVWSPKLDAGAAIGDDTAAFDTQDAAAASGDDAAQTETAKAAASAAAAATSPRTWRFPLLAATIALAAALGSFVGSLTGSGVARLVPDTASSPDIADTSAILRALKTQIAELAAMKSSFDGAVRNANVQFAALTDRLDRAERTAASPSAQLSHIADTVDRLDRLNAAPETTSSIAPRTAPGGDPKLTDRIVEGWLVQDVHGDRALIENRNGGLFEVGAGSVLPGLGRIESVKRQDGQWVVVTARGLITSGR